jgi:1-acyl-sn-glycerol-3-phosphate acyltransferase
MSGRPDEPEALRRYSPRLVAIFVAWLEGYFRRSFDGVRLARAGAQPSVADGPLIVYANHPSWWDPIHFLLIAPHAVPGRRLYGPMDATALDRYRFFKRIGVFGIDPRTRRGAAEFLRTGRAVLAAPGASLWVTAQGEFCDPRQRPVGLQQGVARLASELGRGTVLPLAVEYPFWNERLPEALSRFGEPIDVVAHAGASTAEWAGLLEQRLEATMAALAEDAAARDPDRFHTLVLGRAGVGGLYDRWRRLAAAFAGRRFDPAHGAERR